MQALDTTIANVALPYIQGSVVGERGPDQLGADLLHRRRRDHDAAFRLPRQQVRTQARSLDGDRGLRDRFDPLRRIAIADRDRRVPPDAGPVRRGAGAAVARHSARHLRRQGARIGDGAVRRLGDGRAGAGAGDRRLVDRQHQLALGVLHQRADRRAGVRRHQLLRARDQEGRRRQARLARLRRAERRHRRAADFSRSRRAARLVLVRRNPDRGDRLRVRVLCLPRPHVHGFALVREPAVVSRPQFRGQSSSSSSSSASPISPRSR